MPHYDAEQLNKDYSATVAITILGIWLLLPQLFATSGMISALHKEADLDMALRMTKRHQNCQASLKMVEWAAAAIYRLQLGTLKLGEEFQDGQWWTLFAIVMTVGMRTIGMYIVDQFANELAMNIWSTRMIIDLLER